MDDFKNYQFEESSLSLTVLHFIVDFKQELKKMNREILFCYLKLINAIISTPSRHSRHLENLGILLRNIHQLLNLMQLNQVYKTRFRFLSINLIALAFLKIHIGAVWALAEECEQPWIWSILP